jgi:flavodoxin I
MNVAIIYTSKTGNTQELVKCLYGLFKKQKINIHLYQVEQFPIDRIPEFNAIIIGTYTWGKGEIPSEMHPIFEAFEFNNVGHILTGVVGTGDRFYPHFCGAVDRFRDMLFVRTELVATLKVELSPQTSDMNRCIRFVELMLNRSKIRSIN